jgi:uncharacterized protein with HEPN domain
VGRDRTRRLAVERRWKIIGEAARALSDEGRARYAEVPWLYVIGLRTVVTHHYHRVDSSQVWTIATTEVPRLMEHLSQKA